MTQLIDPIAQIVLLLRFFCFMAVFYLALHKIVARLSRKPDSKLLWFFGVLTAPLTWPVKRYSSPDATDDQIVSYSLIFYGLLWMVLIFAGRYWVK
ncbi:MAG TPA: hypothetical protein VFQ89_02585 [Candidatus Binatia bacterium]|nr:hypothetical protein [Candidatus Binatia bacterium]